MDPRLLFFLVLVAAACCIAATVTGGEPRPAAAFSAFFVWSLFSLAMLLPRATPNRPVSAS